MKKAIGAMSIVAGGLAACGSLPGSSEATPEGVLKEVPEAVRAIADPRQDLTAVRIDPADGCYLYRYVGPVETTFLPLRTTAGRPICGAPPTVEETA